MASQSRSLEYSGEFELDKLPREQVEHLYIEAARLAFADRNAYVGDPEYVEVPVRGLLSKDYAKQRAAFDQSTAKQCHVRLRQRRQGSLRLPTRPSIPLRPSKKMQEERKHTTHLTVSDREGNIVSYTYTIEDWGGNGMVVPGYGFLEQRTH